MEISGTKLIFLFGCAGGAALELLRWWKLRESADWPVYVRKPSYWILTVAMILTGGVIAIAYGTEKTNAILAMNVGAAAPAIIGALASPPPSRNGGTGATGQNELGFGGAPAKPGRLRRFLAFG